ncbi:MAG: rhodanese-like domain-containing protein, partial [Desulfocucumaceae bacterium]
MRKGVIVLTVILLFLNVLGAEAVGKAVAVMVNGRQVSVEPGAFLSQDRVFVPARFIAEELGALVEWDEASSTVIINDRRGDVFLKGQNHQSGTSGIMNNLIKAADLRDALDDDRDSDLADYRQGKSGGDNISNDPLVVDLRKQEEYSTSHIPGAVWVATAQSMGEPQSIAGLKEALEEHRASGGKNEIVLYCYTGNTSGLVAGSLGSLGLPVKSMMYGFDIAWQGTKFAHKAIKAP